MSKKKAPKIQTREMKCLCPFCEEEIPCFPFTFCQPCGITLRYCPKCQIAVQKETTVCPRCGAAIA